MGERADLRVFGWGGKRGGQILEFLDGGESRSESFWMGGGGGQILEFLDGAPITTFFEL